LGAFEASGLIGHVKYALDLFNLSEKDGCPDEFLRKMKKKAFLNTCKLFYKWMEEAKEGAGRAGM